MSGFEIFKKLAIGYFSAAFLQALFVICLMTSGHNPPPIILFFWAFPVMELYGLTILGDERLDAGVRNFSLIVFAGAFMMISLLQFHRGLREKLSRAWAALTQAEESVKRTVGQQMRRVFHRER